MKCTNKAKYLIVCIFILISTVLTGCEKSKPYSMEYDLNSPVSAYRFTGTDKGDRASFFAEDLCVITDSVSNNTMIDTSQSEAVLLCDLNDHQVLYNKNSTEQLNPASLTKVMTAIIALKYGNLDDMLTASSNVTIQESGASLVGISPGDTMTLSQALHALLIASGNDAAVMIAEYISGSVDQFVELMNTEALELGATNCHFMNPHGLTQDAHYVTAYDMYLIFNEAIKYDEFIQIISSNEYTGVYHDAQGEPKELTLKSTNNFINGNHSVPGGVVVMRGKTGTTSAAGNCLVLLSKDSYGNPYISVILKCTQRDYLYDEMYDLIATVNQS